MSYLLVNTPQDAVCEMCELCMAKNGTSEIPERGSPQRGGVRGEEGFT